MATPILRKNESCSYEWTGGLLADENGITLWCTDPFNHWWAYSKLAAGSYQLAVLYWNEKQQPHRRQEGEQYFAWFGDMPAESEVFWVGKAWTALDVEVVP